MRTLDRPGKSLIYDDNQGFFVFVLDKALTGRDNPLRGQMAAHIGVAEVYRNREGDIYLATSSINEQSKRTGHFNQRLYCLATRLPRLMAVMAEVYEEIARKLYPDLPPLDRHAEVVEAAALGMKQEHEGELERLWKTQMGGE
jgi:hypothetical protein